MADLETNLAIIQEFSDRLAVTVVGAEETTAKHERFVEGEVDETIPTENGPIKTLKGKIKQWDDEIGQHLIDIGFEPAVAYDDGIVITRRSQTVIHNSIIYFWSGSFPLTTTGLFDEGSWLTTPINNHKYVGDTAPTGVSHGATWFDTTSGKSFIFYVDGDGTGSWVEENATGAVAVTGKFVSATAPLNPVHGNSWYCTLDGRTYIFYEDGSSSQWVEENPQSSSEEGLKITVRENLKRSCAEAGLTLVNGSFEEGASVSLKTQVIWQQATGKVFAWFQDAVKTVGAGSTPETTGGVSSTAWVDKTGETLRGSLSSIGGIRLSSACKSLSELLTLDNPFDNQRVDVLGFYSSSIRGGGTFRFQSSVPKSSHNGITVVSPTVPFNGNKNETVNFLDGIGEIDPTGTGCWVRSVKSSFVNISWGGAVIDGVFDDSPICQRVHNLGLHVEYDPGTYLFSQGVVPKPGQRVFSNGVGFFNFSNDKNVSIANNAVDGSIFKYVDDISTGQIDSPCIYGFRATADYPILMNNFTAYIEDGVTGGCPYLMKPYITNNVLVARQTGIGIGLHLSKAFDGDISGNDIYNFAINLSLLGCDLNTVIRNRIVGHTLYGILDRGAQTFGSQNDIRMNDVLAGGPNSIYIKSTNRHPRIYNNYCEKTDGPLLGFIDITPNNLPVWNPLNVDPAPKSIFVRDNRLDGHVYCTEFVYRINADQPCPMTVIEDSSTSGQPATVDVLSIVSLDNTKTLRLALGNSNFNFPEYHFKGPFGRYSGFSSRHFSDELKITAENIAKVINGDIYGNGFDNYLRINGESICILPGFTQPAFMRLPAVGDVNNPYFADGVTYTCEIIARTTTHIGDTLKAARLVDGGGDPLNTFSLTQQWKKFTFNMVGPTVSHDVGVYLVRDTQNGIIEIKSIKFV